MQRDGSDLTGATNQSPTKAALDRTTDEIGEM
jgi:hypothetical protein